MAVLARELHCGEVGSHPALQPYPPAIPDLNPIILPTTAFPTHDPDTIHTWSRQGIQTESRQGIQTESTQNPGKESRQNPYRIQARNPDTESRLRISTQRCQSLNHTLTRGSAKNDRKKIHIHTLMLLKSSSNYILTPFRFQFLHWDLDRLRRLHPDSIETLQTALAPFKFCYCSTETSQKLHRDSRSFTETLFKLHWDSTEASRSV